MHRRCTAFEDIVSVPFLNPLDLILMLAFPSSVSGRTFKWPWNYMVTQFANQSRVEPFSLSSSDHPVSSSVYVVVFPTCCRSDGDWMSRARCCSIRQLEVPHAEGCNWPRRDAPEEYKILFDCMHCGSLILYRYRNQGTTRPTSGPRSNVRGSVIRSFGNSRIASPHSNRRIQ